jgi:hypothetical protein
MLKILIGALGAGAFAVYLAFGTASPCGILREEVRRAAVREGGLGFLASMLPDSVIDGMLAEQFGPLSPGRCIGLALQMPQRAAVAPKQPQPQAAAPVQAPPLPQERVSVAPGTPEAMRQAAFKRDAAIQECRAMRLAG